MEILSLTVSVLLLSVIPQQQDSGDPYAIAVVKNALREPRNFSSGFSEKQLNRLGDKVSIAILKIYGDEQLKDPHNIEAILPLIHRAFDAPQVIAVESDKHPRVTLLLLRSLETDLKNQELKTQLSDLINFVQQKTG